MQHEAALAFAAGADIVTVLGLAADSTISGTVKAARAAGSGRLVMADLIGSHNLAALSERLFALGENFCSVSAAKYELHVVMTTIALHGRGGYLLRAHCV